MTETTNVLYILPILLIMAVAADVFYKTVMYNTGFVCHGSNGRRGL